MTLKLGKTEFSRVKVVGSDRYDAVMFGISPNYRAKIAKNGEFLMVTNGFPTPAMVWRKVEEMIEMQ